jgi:predicted lactoylglutathione lyase
MTKQFWVNLPVKDVAKSKEFFSRLGFSFNEQMSSNESACLLIGERNMVIMLFAEEVFRGFTKSDASNPTQAAEVLFSFDAESKDEVDQMAQKAVAAGGVLWGKPSESQGWMYGCGFSDLDGHRWNVLYMDMSKMPK